MIQMSGAGVTDSSRICVLTGAAVDEGASRPGCEMGPSAFRVASIAAALAELGYAVRDNGNLVPPTVAVEPHPNPAIRHLPEIAAWTAALDEAAFAAGGEGFAVFLGGDHSLSAGTIAGMSRRAAAEGRPLFVLWLDAHPDFHTLDSTVSGNLHGVGMAYATGRPGFAAHAVQDADFTGSRCSAAASSAACQTVIRCVAANGRALSVSSPRQMHSASGASAASRAAWRKA